MGTDVFLTLFPKRPANCRRVELYILFFFNFIAQRTFVSVPHSRFSARAKILKCELQQARSLSSTCDVQNNTEKGASESSVALEVIKLCHHWHTSRASKINNISRKVGTRRSSYLRACMCRRRPLFSYITPLMQTNQVSQQPLATLLATRSPSRL